MVELKQEPQKLTAFLCGELDHHRAKEIREAIDFAVREQYPPVVVLDFKQVSFMDSSGVALLRYDDFICQCAGGKDVSGDNGVQFQGEDGTVYQRRNG